MNNLTTLLIIDDESSVRRVLTRILSKRADTVLTTATIADALLILETNKITHVICDHLLGPGQQTGIDAVSDWKFKCPSIKSLLILTGAITSLNNTTASIPKGIDAIIAKTTDPMDIADRLKI